MKPITITTPSDDEITFDGKDTFNFAGMETQSLERIRNLIDGLNEMLWKIAEQSLGAAQ